MWSLAAVVVISLFAALVAYIIREGNISATGAGDQLIPTVVSDNGGFALGKTNPTGENLNTDRVRVDIYFDFMCPVCAFFEETQGPALDKMLADGETDIYYHPISILDGVSKNTQYSTRAASASVLIYQEAPDYFLPFLQSMFINQPEEYSIGLTDAQIQRVATDVGVPNSVVKKIPNYSYSSWVRTATEQASISGVTSTPTISINGVIQDPSVTPNDLNWSVEGDLLRVVEAAAKDSAGS